jgi:hypothetical protein
MTDLGPLQAKIGQQALEIDFHMCSPESKPRRSASISTR